MALPRDRRLEMLVLTTALAALIACGSAGDGSTSPANPCSGCEGALCSGRCTDLSPALAHAVQSALPASACVPETAVSGGVTVCSAQICGGLAPGCAVALAWSPVALRHDTHQLEGTVTATSDVDTHLSGTDCIATATATFSYAASAAFACAPGAETATFGTITATLQSSDVTGSSDGCGLLATYLSLYRGTFTSTVQTTVETALARATVSATASCP